jgi:hypothetical protein
VCLARGQSEGDGVRGIKKLCYSYKKWIGARKPALMLENVVTGTLRYFHTRCDEAIAELVLGKLTPYHLMIRYVEAERN